MWPSSMQSVHTIHSKLMLTADRALVLSFAVQGPHSVLRVCHTVCMWDGAPGLLTDTCVAALMLMSRAALTPSLCIACFQLCWPAQRG